MCSSVLLGVALRFPDILPRSGRLKWRWTLFDAPLRQFDIRSNLVKLNSMKRIILANLTLLLLLFLP